MFEYIFFIIRENWEITKRKILISSIERKCYYIQRF